MHLADIPFLNTVFYWVEEWEKEGIGDVFIYGPRFRNKTTIAFKPALSGAGWHKVPDDAILLRMINAGSPMQAMAVLRENT